MWSRDKLLAAKVWQGAPHAGDMTDGVHVKSERMQPACRSIAIVVVK